ncbi:MAG TPA: cytochrome c oxidase assembly protein [Xanthobacteraceae bacterium]|nr:cytochrome c oxidase assembly protein [Xanthobacteraceae bacterium]
MSSQAFVPYCGHPPVPGALIWNTDPVLITALLGIGAAYAWGCRGTGAPSPSERGLFGAGLAITAAALISPLCNLSVALFSARVTQHIVLTLVAAPLVVLGRPDKAWAGIAGTHIRAACEGRHAMTLAGVAFAAAMWTWHLPGPYDATLQNNYVYWTMHVTTFGSALLLWHQLFLRQAERPAAALLVGFGTAMQMSLLGAVLTLAPRALFAVHFGTTSPWGLSPLQDQQLGGLIMWVPGGLLFTAYALVTLALWLGDAREPVRPPQAAQ